MKKFTIIQQGHKRLQKHTGHHFWGIISLSILFISLIAFSNKAFSQAANIDQIRNGSATAPLDPVAWVNGNAGPSNAHYAEGYSIPYRMHVTGLTSGQHVLTIEWDTKDQNGHALDYITHYNNIDYPPGSHMATFGHAAETIDPTNGISGLGSLSEFLIPAPSSAGSEVTGQPTSSFNALPASLRKMSVWGGTIDSMKYDFQEAPDATTGSTTTRMSIYFTTTTETQVLFAWGGHIAAEYDWGVGRGATGVNGSPYHTRLIAIDGSGGNQDRSLKASAVVIPPPLCGISAAQYACPETDTLYFSATGSSSGLGISYSWTLTNGSPSAGAMIFGSSTGFNIKVVPTGTDFLPGGTFNLSLTVHRVGATSTSCSRTPAGTIVNVIVDAVASPTIIDLTSALHNTTLNALILAGSTDPDTANYTYVWQIMTAGTAGTLTGANFRTATYTAGLLDAGSTIKFKVTATQKSAPNCVDVDSVTINVSSVGICDVSPQGPVCQGSTTTHNSSPNPKPSNATYTWSIGGYGGSGSTTSTLASTNGGVSMQVNANSSYRITLSQTYSNTALNTSCYEDVTVVPTPTVTAVYNPPACDQNTFTVDVVSPVLGNTYTIDQQGNSLTFSPITPTSGSPNVHFTGLTAGDGFIVTVTTATASCIDTFRCGAVSLARIATPENDIIKETPDDKKDKEVKEAVELAKQAPGETYNIILESPTRVDAIPNPYSDRVRFNMLSAISGRATLELYNLLGQKIATVYEGYVSAGKELSIEYDVPFKNRTSLVYVFKVGDQKATGKLIGPR